MARTNNFDALRLMAALAVLASHMAPLSGRIEWKWMGEHSAGSIGVLIFFSISGYLISASWRADPDMGRFLSKRYLRIFPGLAVALFVTYCLVIALGLSGFPGNPTHSMNRSLWTIPYEVYCYLLIAGAGLLAAKPVPVFAAGMLVAYAVMPNHYLAYFGLFFAGGALLQAFPAFHGWRVAGLLTAGGAGVFLSTGNTQLALALSVPPLAVLIGNKSWPVLRRAGRFGDLSYGIYIYAWPMQQVVIALMPKDSSYYALVAVSTLVVVLLAWLSWRYVEAPALRRKPVSAVAPVAPPDPRGTHPVASSPLPELR